MPPILICCEKNSPIEMERVLFLCPAEPHGSMTLAIPLALFRSGRARFAALNGPAQAAYAIDVLVQTIADAEQALEGQSIQGQFRAERHQPEWFRVLERGGSGLVECLVLVKLHFITSDIIYRKMR